MHLRPPTRRRERYQPPWRYVDLSPTASGAAGPLASDTFTRDDAATLGNAETGQAWTAHTGTWSIASNQVQPPALTGTYATASVDVGELLVTVEVTVTPPASGAIDVGIAGRVIDNNNFVFLDVSVSGPALVSRTFERVGGTFTGLTALVDPASLAPRDPFTMRLVFTAAGEGESFLNDVSMGTFTGLHATLQTPTRYGLAVGDASGPNRYDNFTVTAT